MNNLTFRRTTFFVLFSLLIALSTVKAQTLYSFKSGDYNDPSIWTLNSSGITYDNPGAITPVNGNTGDGVVILSGRTVTISPSFSVSPAPPISYSVNDPAITILEGGILEIASNVTSVPSFSTLVGQGTLLMHSTTNFPSNIASSNFLQSGGGTVEYNYPSGNIVLPSQDTYNNLVINLGAASASAIVSRSVLPIPTTLPGLAPFTINGNLSVKQGIFQIGENGIIGNAPSSDVRLKITIGGDVTVASTGAIKVGMVNPNNSSLTAGEFGGRVYSDYDQNTSTWKHTTQPGPFYILRTNNDSKLPFKSGTYHQIHHQVYIGGSLTNNGIVKFHNLTTLDLDQISGGSTGLTSATSGAATVFFQGLANDTLTCNGQTDFYNLVLNKGTDPTYSLTINPSTYTNFRLWGPTSIGADQNNYLPNNVSPNGNPNPIMRKALWINNGTLKLTGKTVIPSLSEAGDDVVGSGLNTDNYTSTDPTGDFYVPANGAMVIDGPEVIVLTTADYASEVAMAYGLSTANVQGVLLNQRNGNQSLSVYGSFTINSGYLSAREAGGLIYWSIAGGAGNVTINGGIVDAKQFRSAEQTPAGRSTFTMNGGIFRLRGRFQNFDSTPSFTDVTSLRNMDISGNLLYSTIRATNGMHAGIGTFNIGNTANVFTMSAGIITILDVGTNPTVNTPSYPRMAFEVNSSTTNSNITGGVVNINVIPKTGNVTEPFGNGDDPYGDRDYYVKSTAPLYNLNISRSASGTKSVILNTQPLVVKNNLTVNSGVFDASGLNVTIGKDFNLYSSAQYITGTNTTTFNGAGNQNFLYSSNNNITFTGSTLGLKNLIINKSAGTLAMGGSGTDLTVNGSLSLLSGTFDDGGVAITVKDSVINSATHTSTNGGKIILGGTALQIINGNGNGIFANLQLNNVNGAKFINAGQSVSRQLRLEAGILDINIYPLTITDSLSTAISPNSVNGLFSPTNMIRTAGNQSDGGVIKQFNASTNQFTFPVGTGSNYTPAIIQAFASGYGRITVKPVSTNHPFLTLSPASLSNDPTYALQYYWKVVSNGFVGISSVSHQYFYGSLSDNTNYKPGRYNPTSWNPLGGGPLTDVNNPLNSHRIQFTTTDKVDGDYTAAVTAALGTVTAYYSRVNGNWADFSGGKYTTWSSSLSGVANVTTLPGSNNPVIIKTGTTVTIPSTDLVPKSVGATEIQTNAVLDVTTTTGHNFGALPDLKVTGSGTLRISSAAAPPASAEFPAGDFGNFIGSNGGTVEYYTTGATSFNIPSKSASPTLLELASYNNLTISPGTGLTITMPDRDIRLYGDLTVNGVSSTGVAQLSNGTTTTTRNLTINGSISIKGGRLRFMNAAIRNIILDGFRSNILDINGNRIDGRITIGNGIATSGAGFDMNSSNSAVHTISLVGSIFLNTGFIDFNPGSTSNTRCKITFNGTSNEVISGINSANTRVGQLIINKGTSQTPTLTLSVTGTNPFSLPSANGLALQNGTFRYVNSGSSTTLNISNNTGTIQIPATAAFNMEASVLTNVVNFVTASNDGADLLLSGKLKVISGIVNVGSSTAPVPAFNNDIEYAAAGLPEIEVTGGRLYVNGQIRRPAGTNITLGSLVYNQSGGDVIIGGNSSATGLAVANTRAKFEVDNGANGSVFNMSGGTLTILRGNGNISDYGDLYIHPGSSTVTGGTIILAPGTAITSPALSSGGNQTYTIDSNVDLYNVAIGDGGTYSSINQLNINPLRLLGDLNIQSNSTLDTKGLNVRVSGNFTNNGIYLPGTNTTTFNGNANKIATFNSPTAFNNLTINKSGVSLTLAGTSGKPAVMGNLSLNNGTLNDGGKTLLAMGNIANSALHTSTSGKIDLQLGVQSVTFTPGSYQLPSVTAGFGNGASFKMTIIDGKIMAITVVSGGTGYSAGSLIFGNEAGTGAAASFSVNSGVITSVTVTNGGSGYGPVVTVSNSNTGNDAILQSILTTTTASTTTSGIGVVSAVNLIYPGSDYSSGLPSVTVVPPTVGAAALIPATVSVSTNTTQSILSGNGSGQFGNLSINNPGGAELSANMTVNGILNLAVDGSDGLLYLNNNKLTLGINATITGVSISNNKRFIRTNGVLSDGGLEKAFTNGLSNATFLFPIGVTGKYTPADYTLSTGASGSSLAVKPIDATHPNVNPALGIGPDYLKYYWNVTGNVASLAHKYHYIATDALGDPNNYISARFNTPIWDKGSNADVDPTNNVISFNKAGAISGDYTAGETNVFQNPTPYISNNSGDYTNTNIWTPTPPVGGPPSGSIVTISNNNMVAINENSKYTTSLTIYGTLDLGSTDLHNFGTVVGTGLLKISANNTDFAFPAGNYDAFTSKTGGTVEYYGSADGTLLTQSTFNKLVFSGNSTKELIQNILVNSDLTINAGTLSNTTYNKNITLKGNWVNMVGTAGFAPGTGTVTLNSGTAQTIGPNPSIFNNITISGTGTSVTNNADLTANGNLIIGASDSLQNTGNNVISLKGNWTNNGVYKVGSGTAGVILSGTNQLIGGTSITNFKNLTILGGGNKTLNQLTKINGALAFNKGYIVSTTTNLLQLGELASVSGASDSSFVAGPMTKDISTASPSRKFTFPIGKIVNGSGRYAQIDIINAGDASYKVEYFAATPTNNGNYGSPLTGISDLEYWNLTSSTNNAVDVKLTYRPSSGFPPLATPPSRVYAVRYDAPSWKDINSYSDITYTAGNASGNITANAISTFGLFTFGFTSSEFVSLPVRLLTFQGKWNNGKVDLEWITASEENNSYFEVERSIDAQNFVSIGGLDGKGTTNFSQRYQFTDENPLAGISYYRLKQVDSNGDFEYSKIISIVNPTITDVLVLYPNPVANSAEVSLQINSAQDNTYLITIHDVQGKILARNEYPTVKGMNELPVLQDIHLARGMYFVRVQAGLFNRQFKLVVD